MMKTERGQIIIIVSALLVVVLLFFAVLIDGTRLFIEEQEINRGLDAAGKAGLIVVGDQMITQVISAQTLAASITPSASANLFSSDPTPTETLKPDDLYAWLTDEHRQTLVAPPLQTLVATHVLGSLDENGLGLDHPDLIGVNITYPANYHPDANDLQIILTLDRKVAILFGNVLEINEGVLTGCSKQTIPQR